jgi:hypothetical protein
MKKSLKLIIDSLRDEEAKEQVRLYAKNKVVMRTVLIGNMLLVLDLADPFSIVPQLTFTCHITNCVAIISKFLLKGTIGYDEIKTIINAINKLKLNTVQSNYLFLIMYMSRMHLKYKAAGTAGRTTYYKYFMTFLPRHEFSVLVDKFRSACTEPELAAFLKAPSVASHFGADYAAFLFSAISENRDISNIDDDIVSTLFEAKDDVVYIEFRGLAQCIKYFLNLDTNRVGVVQLYNAVNKMATRTRRVQAGR